MSDLVFREREDGSEWLCAHEVDRTIAQRQHHAKSSNYRGKGDLHPKRIASRHGECRTVVPPSIESLEAWYGFEDGRRG